MANTSLEMTYTNVSDRPSTGNIQLDNAITRIYVAYKRGNGAMQDIAIELYNIKSKELYKVNGIEHFSDFAENVLKISKSKASRMCAVAKRFLICTEAEEEATREKYNKFNFTQLSEMLSADDDVLEFINPEMTSKEIRDFINNAKHIGTNDQNDNDQNDNDQNDNDQNDNDQNDNDQSDNNQNEPTWNDNTDEHILVDEAKDETNKEYGYIDTDMAITTYTSQFVYDEAKTITADDYSIYIDSNDNVVSITCNSIKGLKNVHTWLNKNKAQITKSFIIRFDISENEQ